MKRKIFILTVLLFTLLTALFSTACSKKSEPLKDYDFSLDNVVEVRISSSPMFINLHGTIYGVKKGDSQEGDEAIKEIALAWDFLQKDATFTKKEKRFSNATGGTYYYECIFADGSSIKIRRDRMDNLYFNDGKSMRIDFDYKLNFFHSKYASIIQKGNIVGHISQGHDENCDCDAVPEFE